jgi:hypothetical protein
MKKEMRPRNIEPSSKHVIRYSTLSSDADSCILNRE